MKCFKQLRITITFKLDKSQKKSLKRTPSKNLLTTYSGLTFGTSAKERGWAGLLGDGTSNRIIILQQYLAAPLSVV